MADTSCSGSEGGALAPAGYLPVLLPTDPELGVSPRPEGVDDGSPSGKIIGEVNNKEAEVSKLTNPVGSCMDSPWLWGLGGAAAIFLATTIFFAWRSSSNKKKLEAKSARVRELGTENIGLKNQLTHYDDSANRWEDTARKYRADWEDSERARAVAKQRIKTLEHQRDNKQKQVKRLEDKLADLAKKKLHTGISRGKDGKFSGLSAKKRAKLEKKAGGMDASKQYEKKGKK
ncbi:hypothetical protein FWH13_03060 [Candidatus Saccharibacteria bacterium]|nr:hypothetical protein [Candidatus Saccharibacteria bacterium]